MESRELLAINLRVIREELKFSKSTIAGFLKISYSIYTKFESSDLVPNVEILQQLSNLYSIEEYTFYEQDQQKLLSELPFKPKAHNFNPADLQQIAKFNKIARNYLNMCYELMLPERHFQSCDNKA